jgi:hypothetical protein
MSIGLDGASRMSGQAFTAVNRDEGTSKRKEVNFIAN